MGTADDGSVLGRATLLLEIVEAAGCIKQTDLARDAGLPKPTVRRIAADLVDRGLLSRCPDGYELGPRLFSLGAAALARHPFRAAIAPDVQDLLARAGEVAFVQTVEPDLSIVTLHVAYSHSRATAVTATLGGWPTIEPVEPAILLKASGRVAYAEHPDRIEALLAAGLRRRTRYSAPTRRTLLAAIDATLERGTAVEHEEHTLGWSCIASGVRDHDGHVVGIVGVIGRSGAWNPERLQGPITSVAEALSAAIPMALPPESRRTVEPPASH